jgi:hypothetical protein
MLEDNGKGSTTAVDEGSLSFARVQFWRQGVDGRDRRLPRDEMRVLIEYEEAMATRLWRLARETFELARAEARSPVRRELLEGVPLDVSVEPAPRAVLAQLREKPPPHEAEFHHAHRP